MFHPIASLAEPRGALAVAATVLFAAAVGLAAKRNPFVFVALCLVAVPLLPTLYIPGMGENPFAERYLYLPSVGFALLAAFGLIRIAALAPAGRAVAAVVCLAVAALYTAGTVARNPVWKNDYTFWADAAAKSPDGPVPHYNLGTVLAARGKLDEAIEQYRIAIGLKPAAVAFKSLGAAYDAKGERGKAVEAYLGALRLEPDDVSTYLELGALYGETGARDKAIESFEAAVRLQPGNANAHYDLGIAYKEQGLVGKAVEQFEAAVRLNPSDPVFRGSLRDMSGTGGHAR